MALKLGGLMQQTFHFLSIQEARNLKLVSLAKLKALASLLHLWRLWENLFFAHCRVKRLMLLLDSWPSVCLLHFFVCPSASPLCQMMAFRATEISLG
jgi:hypothetical protein